MASRFPYEPAAPLITSNDTALPRVYVEASAELPTAFGPFRIYVFVGGSDRREHVALVKGELWGASDALVRVHSECLTGDLFASLRCDCGEQLHRALDAIAEEPCGALLYLRQEGRGIGLINKVRAYALQQKHGLDTVEANEALGFPDDARDYGVAVSMLRTLGVRSVRLMTNNPDKVGQLALRGMPVTSRVAHAVEPCEHNRAYLETKARKSGHILEAVLSATRREG